MASMAAGYGPRRRFLKAAAGLGCLVFTRSAQAAPVRLLVLGDSLAAGYGLARADGFQARQAAALQAARRDVVLVDGAVSGDTTAGGRARLEWVLADRVDAALVELGGNDGLRGLEPAAVEANLAAILDGLAARRIPVLFSGMIAPPGMGADYTRAFRAVFDRLGVRSGLIYDPFFLEGVAGDSALNQPDGIHPNAEGVRRIVARLLPLVERLLNEVRAP